MTGATKAVAKVRRLHGRPVDGVPRWVVWAAYATTLTVLPSGIWRIAVGFGVPLGPLETGGGDPAGILPSWLPLWVYPILLSVFIEGLAFLTVGLVSCWGEVFPRWIPFVGGRRVPTPAAVIPAGLGAAALIWMTVSLDPSTLNDFTGPDGVSRPLGGWQLGVFIATYGPLVAWGPLLMVVTVAYYLRRRRTSSDLLGRKEV